MAENQTNRTTQSPFPKMEEDVLSFWDKGKIFEKTLEKEAPQGGYVFYDGPPFATGEPHYGHIVASLMKDSVPRYWTMKGFHVDRKWGWDCHGLPIENIAEKELGIKRKKEIEEMGVEKFNEFCRSKVLGYVDIWKKVIRRLGRWADMENSYKTMDLPFMESVWWVFKELWNRGLIYEGYRSMHVCPRCETTLSQQEVAEGYKNIKDLSATVKFELIDEPGTFVLAWTTTPWTLIGNVALAVGEDMDYVKIREISVVEVSSNHVYELPPLSIYIVAKDIFKREDQKVVPKDNLSKRYFFHGKIYEIIGNEFKGKKLINKTYKPLFDYYFKNENLENRENGWKIYAGDFVTTEEGTGVVHIAPAFGEDDMNIGKEYKLPFVQHVNMDGTIKTEAEEFAGLNVKPTENTQATDIEIIKYLAHNGLLFHKEKYEHSYPHCWRCDTPLINYATSSWFVNVLKIKDEALELAKNVNWFPEHIKDGRFGNWLAGARDWSISRQRFWASVIPIWRCECGEVKVFGSVKELEDACGEKIKDLHKHIVDKIILKCEKCGGQMKRVPDVLDTWFDSGSMPYAQMHYPFENKEKFEKNFPAEFIAEGIDQTRAWFYYLHVITTSIKKSHAFKNVIVNGIVLAEDGKKMSKRLKNYPDPTLIFEKYGADAMRFYLLSSPVMAAENLNFFEEGVREALQKNIMILWNVYKFYEMFTGSSLRGSLSDRGNSVNVANSDEIATPSARNDGNVLDQWILAKLNLLIEEVTKSMDGYDLPRSVRPITEFINELSTWYLRRSRDRFKSEDENDKKAAIETTAYVLIELSKVMAPFMPFIAETIWQKVTGHDFKDDNKSVHLENWPKQSAITNEQLTILDNMQVVMHICELGAHLRDKSGIKVRQPLSLLKYDVLVKRPSLKNEFISLISDELNIKNIVNEKIEEELNGSLKEKDNFLMIESGGVKIALNLLITEDLKLEGIKRELVRTINALRKEAGMTIEDRAEIFYAIPATSEKSDGTIESGYLVEKAIEKFAKEIMAETLSESLKAGSEGELKKELKIDGEIIKLGIIKK